MTVSYLMNQLEYVVGKMETSSDEIDANILVNLVEDAVIRVAFISLNLTDQLQSILQKTILLKNLENCQSSFEKAYVKLVEYKMFCGSDEQD